MKGVFRKIDDMTLLAVDMRALEALAAVHQGENCMGDVRGARNVEQFGLFWTLMGLVSEATDYTKEACKDWLLRKLKYLDMIQLPDGSVLIKPKSISWEKMPQADFSIFFTAAIPHIAELLDTAPEDVIKRFEDMLSPEGRAHYRKLKGKR